MPLPAWLKSKKFIVPTVLIIVLAGFLAAKNSQTALDGDSVQGNDIKSVTVLTIKPQEKLVSTVILKGTAAPKEHAVLRSRVSGDLRYLRPVGDSIRTGEVVAGISDERIEDGYFNSLQASSQARQNLTQIGALNEETILQAELAVSSALASWQQAQTNYANQLLLTEQETKQTQDQARLAFETAYDQMEQTLRYWSDGALVKFRLADALVTNFDLKLLANDEFYSVVKDFNTLSARPGDDLARSLRTLEPVLERVKAFNDLVYRYVSFMATGNNFTQSQIDAHRSQAALFTTQLNSQNQAVKSAANALATRAVTAAAALSNAQSQVDQTQIQYDNALASLESAKRRAEIAELGAQSQLTVSSSQLSASSAQYNDLSLNAPFAGVVIAHLAAAGGQISPGDALLELGDISGVEITLSIDQTSSQLISVGQEVLVNDEIKAIISEINPSASLQTGKMELKVTAGKSTLAPGDITEVRLELEHDLNGVIVVPLSLVTVGQNENYVLVVENGKVAKRIVRLGQVYDSQVEVIEGLSEGDLVIESNGNLLSLGESVEIKE